jgi:hypothetical protein
MVSIMSFGAAAALGLPERYFAFRLRLDRALFADLADGRIASPHALDRALARLGLRASTPGARPLAERAQGARLLLQRHGIVLIGQSVAFLLGLMTQNF